MGGPGGAGPGWGRLTLHLGLLTLTAVPSWVVLVYGSGGLGGGSLLLSWVNSSDPLQRTDRGEFLTPAGPIPTPSAEEGVGYRGSSPKKDFLWMLRVEIECRLAGRDV